MQAIAQRRFRTVVVGRKIAGAPSSGMRTMCSRSGQSLIEACMVIIVLCLIVFGVAQRSQMYMALEILDHAAVCGARARAVGFNDFMVQKTIRAAAIPLAGQMIQPSYVSNPYAIIPTQRPHVGGAWDTALRFRGGSGQTRVEKIQLPYYLGSGDWGEAAGYLDYQLNYLDKYGAKQRTTRFQDLVNASLTENGASVTATVSHDFPLNFAFHRALYSGLDILPLQGKATIEKHYDLYLQ